MLGGQAADDAGEVAADVHGVSLMLLRSGVVGRWLLCRIESTGCCG